jgi:CRP-like cAMP-binding protein
VIRQCLARDPEQRPASARAVAGILESPRGSGVSMKARFEGERGQARLLGALARNRLVGHEDVARRLAEAGVLAEFPQGATVIRQGDADDDVHFIIAGECEIRVDGRTVGRRGVGEPVGEMAAIDPCVPRSASVVASTLLVTLRVDEGTFLAVAEAHPTLWRHLALLFATKLREREEGS